MTKNISPSVSPFIIIVITFNIFLTSSNCTNTRSNKNVFHTFPDKHTLALWLFDESDYNYSTLCDASENYYDLRLMADGRMATGKYGNSLTMSGSTGHVVSYAGFAGKVVNNHIRKPDGEISGLWGPTEGPEQLLKALAEGIWTFEFWLKLDKISKTVTLLDMGQGYDPGFLLTLNDAGHLNIFSSYSGISAQIKTDPDVVMDQHWHHYAFAHNGSAFRFYLDGSEHSEIQMTPVDQQPLPDIQKPENREHEDRNFESMSFEERRKNRFNLTIGHVRAGGEIISGAIDEIRFSGISRYNKNFDPPASFSRKLGAYGATVSIPIVPTGPSPLFSDDKSEKPLQFGLRKYVFIDDRIIENASGVEIRMNQPTDRQKTDFKPEKSAWRPTIVDIDDQVYLYVPEGYDSEEGRTFLYTSKDGLHFSEHKNSPVIKDLPLYGTFYEDKNPNILPEEQYKLTSWIGNRGIHLFFSPDGIHWRRNETLILPLVSGGSAESYYDDQRGCYSLFIRRDSSFRTSTCPGGVRQCHFLYSNGSPAGASPGGSAG